MVKKIKQQIHIILASSSSVRKKILEDLGLEFDVITPDFDEEKAKEKIGHLSIRNQALYLAQNKALSISVKHPNSLVIGSDQICQLGKLSLAKSGNKDGAIAQLKQLNGKVHYQNNATCLYRGKKELLIHFEKAELKMRKLTFSQICAYVDLDSSWNSAGSYKFESLGKHLFTEVNGSDNCIFGMAILPVINFLHQNKFISIA